MNTLRDAQMHRRNREVSEWRKTCWAHGRRRQRLLFHRFVLKAVRGRCTKLPAWKQHTVDCVNLIIVIQFTSTVENLKRIIWSTNIVQNYNYCEVMILDLKSSKWTDLVFGRYLNSRFSCVLQHQHLWGIFLQAVSFKSKLWAQMNDENNFIFSDFHEPFAAIWSSQSNALWYCKWTDSVFGGYLTNRFSCMHFITILLASVEKGGNGISLTLSISAICPVVSVSYSSLR